MRLELGLPLRPASGLWQVIEQLIGKDGSLG